MDRSQDAPGGEGADVFGAVIAVQLDHGEADFGSDGFDLLDGVIDKEADDFDERSGGLGDDGGVIDGDEAG
jgi:hypothetical protein